MILGKINSFPLRLDSIFDKSNAGYKEKDWVEKTWNEIYNSLEIEEGITLRYGYFIFHFMIMITGCNEIVPCNENRGHWGDLLVHHFFP